jgi:hypothetical protein
MKPTLVQQKSEKYHVEWQNAEVVSSCAICGADFGVFTRKHHCRACGQVICNTCSR